MEITVMAGAVVMDFFCLPITNHQRPLFASKGTAPEPLPLWLPTARRVPAGPTVATAGANATPQCDPHSS